MTNDECLIGRVEVAPDTRYSFVIRIWDLFRHSSFVIRHSSFSLPSRTRSYSGFTHSSPQRLSVARAGPRPIRPLGLGRPWFRSSWPESHGGVSRHRQIAGRRPGYGFGGGRFPGRAIVRPVCSGPERKVQLGFIHLAGGLHHTASFFVTGQGSL